MLTTTPKTYLWTIQILNHVAFATNMCARMFERLVLPICKFGSRTVGCCEHVASVLRYPSYQRNQTGEVLSETNYCGTVTFQTLQTQIGILSVEQILVNHYMHDEYQIFYTKCINIYFSIFITLFY